MRKKAAAVPASKAKIGTIYAVMREGKLTRFRVTKVTTHRIADNGSPHDYRSEITGEFILGHSEDGYKSEAATIEPDKLLGQFDEYQELVAERKAEEAAAKSKADAEKQAADDLVALLYDISGLPISNDRWRAPFAERYSGVEISRDAVAALLPKLRELIKEKVQA
jgi:hypothetical protein